VRRTIGPESGGKTTLALHAAAEAQKAGGIAAFIDAEHPLDISCAKALGVDIEKLLVSQPSRTTSRSNPERLPGTGRLERQSANVAV
jgi:RecA/RadA recombinase